MTRPGTEKAQADTKAKTYGPNHNSVAHSKVGPDHNDFESLQAETEVAPGSAGLTLLWLSATDLSSGCASLAAAFWVLQHHFTRNKSFLYQLHGVL